MEVENLTGSPKSSTGSASERSSIREGKHVVRAGSTPPVARPNPSASSFVMTFLEKGNKDPFDSLPVVSPDSSELINYCKNTRVFSSEQARTSSKHHLCRSTITDTMQSGFSSG